ncbi:AAA family ATPase [Lyngbya confervoides]|uniref:AAA family ATPase n=1 Tax=Lyngbya confervoides BDU141951 TaxID=1574623 RepID=A0ABD4SZZ5_9CYAN|nr:AAA family ATPase [Lyngbya confervoides]MCM1982026.1 AAA family ATPase [Lyngbya confervoides BDU141951]
MEYSKKSFLLYLPLVASVGGGIIIAAGGSAPQFVATMMLTGGAGYATSVVGKQLQAGKYKGIELENDFLRRELAKSHKALGIQTDLGQLEKQKALLSRELDQLNVQKLDLERRIQAIDQSKPDLNQLEKLQNDIGKLTAQINLETGKLEAIANQISEREQQRDNLENLTAQILQKQASITELNDKLRHLNQQAVELELFRSTYDALQRDKDNLTSKKQQLESELPRLEQERDRILESINRLETQAQQANALRNEIEELEAKRRHVNSEVSSLLRQFSQLDSENQRKENEIADKERKLQNINQEIQERKGELAEIEKGVKDAFQALEIPVHLDATQSRSLINEGEFLNQFKQYLQDKGLVFPQRVIHAFHTSLKVQDISALVILAGISGTGKSELPQAYAECIGAPLVMLPVQPRWDSPQDLQGFFNYMEKKYKPTELMRFLYQHQRQETLKGRMVLVLLDEMNLARVEYYFSDFLSKLESRRNKKTYLELDAGSLKLTDQQRQVLIPEEFLFVGTMNEDETTQSLSDKVLDRANVLTFGRPPELKLRGAATKPSPSSDYISWENFQRWTKDPNDILEVTEAVHEYVDKANHIMESLGRPFAHRVYQAFAKYVANYPNADQDEAIRNQAIADQFGQKLLPKLRGVMVEERTVKESLDALERLLAQLGDEALSQAFEKARLGHYGQFQWQGVVYPQD